MPRASRRNCHLVYRTTCVRTNRSYTGVHSTDDLDASFIGKGANLWKSIKRFGAEEHRFEVLCQFATRQEAKLFHTALPKPQNLSIKPPKERSERRALSNGKIVQTRKYHIIYKTTCMVTGKWYIGLHSTDDLNDGYLGSGTQLWKSIKKYGKDQHQVEIIEHCTDRATLIKREAEIVNEDLLQQEACMNLMIGGNANREESKHTKEETRALISQRSKEMWAKRKADPAAMAEHIKKIATPEIVAKRAKANTGKKRTPEQIANLQAGQQSYYSSADPSALIERGQKSAITRTARGNNKGGRPKGIPMTEEEKLKLGQRMKGSSPFLRRISCIACRKETTLGALNRHQVKCSRHANTYHRPNSTNH